MPFLAVATQGSMLSLGTALLPKEMVPIHCGPYAKHCFTCLGFSHCIKPNWQMWQMQLALRGNTYGPTCLCFVFFGIKHDICMEHDHGHRHHKQIVAIKRCQGPTVDHCARTVWHQRHFSWDLVKWKRQAPKATACRSSWTLETSAMAVAKCSPNAPSFAVSLLWDFGHHFLTQFSHVGNLLAHYFTEIQHVRAYN